MLWLVVVAALLAGAAALLATPWLRRSVATAESPLWRWWPQVWLACLLGGLGSLVAVGWVQVVTFVVVGLGLALLVAVDLAEQRLPDVLTYPLYLILFGGLALDTWLREADWSGWLRALAGAGIVIAVFFVLVLLGPFYLGDVKLGGVIGGLLAWFGWPYLIAGVFVGFLVHAVVGLALMLARRATLKTELAFGPSLVAGTVLGPVLLQLLR